MPISDLNAEIKSPPPAPTCFQEEERGAG